MGRVCDYGEGVVMGRGSGYGEVGGINLIY